RGTEVLFVSAEWPSARADHWKTLLRARAIENQMFVVACNRCGTTGDTHFGGGSMIIGPKGEVLFEGGEGEEAGFVTIDLDEVSRFRNFLTVFNDRVPEIYGTHLR
ncbi:MAG: carbon-nitrogen family hydrolase, partial [Synergistaceae bacterium]|nr:carbon-nitrogen family hydrolase [Synergistaceae bacterium]